MRTFEVILALVCVVGGVRSVIHHARRPLDSEDVRDQLLYAVYLTGRFTHIEDPSDYAWFVIVFAVLGAMQLLGSWFLGHRGGPSSEDDGLSPRP